MNELTECSQLNEPEELNDLKGLGEHNRPIDMNDLSGLNGFIGFSDARDHAS